MSRLAQIWSRWVRLTSRRETGESLALFRMLSGVAVVATITSVIAHDLVGPLWTDVAYGGIRALEGNWLVHALGGATPRAVWTIVVATLLAGVALTLGILGRPSALVAGQGLLALSTLNTDARSSYDPLLINSLWLLVLADATATWSWTTRRRLGRWSSDRRVAAWPRHLVVAQLVVLYVGTALHKVSVHWLPGGDFSALYYILQQPSWQRWDMTWLASVFGLTQVATAVTWTWELTWPAVLLAMYFHGTAARPGRLRAVFNRLRVRELYVTIGLVMHISVAVVMELGAFSLIVLAYYPCLYPARVWRTWSAAAHRR
jgi:hypothetical protein